MFRLTTPLLPLCTGVPSIPLHRSFFFFAMVLKLLRIEEELGDKAVYSGKNFRKPSWMA